MSSEIVTIDDKQVVEEESATVRSEVTEKPKISQDGADVIAVVYASHGGDPRDLDLGKCLLVSKLPSSFVSDSFDVFSECVYEMLCEEFNVNREAVERIVRIPKLQTDAESLDNALRAIVMFKSRVHKHRVFAQKKLSTLDGSLSISALDEIPREMLEVDDIEVADEVGDEDGDGTQGEGGDHAEKEVEHHGEGDHESNAGKDHKEEEEPEVVEVEQTSDQKDEANNNDDRKSDTMEETRSTSDKGQKSEEKPERVKKAYIDEDAKAPFEIIWDGAPEFQWKLCTAPGDNRRLILENVLWADMRNPFIYRVMSKAESVDVSFPMRFNLQGNKQMLGKITLSFQFAIQTMQEAVTHLIYVRCPEGRRIKVYLPQTPQAMKHKDDLEDKLGRVIQPTPRMYQLVLKVLPKDEKYSVEDVKKWFPEVANKITEVENVDDELGQPCMLVTLSSVEAVIDAHSAHSFISVTSNEKNFRMHVFMRGVEAHFGSLLTRYDQKKARDLDSRDRVVSSKRPAASIAESRTPLPKRGRGAAPSGPSRGPSIPRGGSTFRGSSRGAYPSNRGGRGGYSSYRDQPAPFTSSTSMRGGPTRYDDDPYRKREPDARSEMWRQQYPAEPRNGPSRFNYSDSRRDSYSHGNGGYDRR